jgi:hypothetical protein
VQAEGSEQRLADHAQMREPTHLQSHVAVVRPTTLNSPAPGGLGGRRRSRTCPTSSPRLRRCRNSRAAHKFPCTAGPRTAGQCCHLKAGFGLAIEQHGQAVQVVRRLAAVHRSGYTECCLELS